MNVEVLVSTMNQKDISIYDKMKIKSDAIIVNQCDENSYIEEIRNNKKIKMYSFAERGVGKSRNTALMRATGDICMMADDDMVYVDEYEDIVINAFKNNPRADMIVFNVRIHDRKGVRERVKKNHRVRLYNCLKYGTVTFAFRRKRIYRTNIFFSLLFGGGAKYGAGEDSLFIWDCIRNGLKVYANENVIADVYNCGSTWFTGYNKKFFMDKGALFAALSKKFSSFLILQFAIRKRKMFIDEISFRDAIKFMFMGAREYKNLS